jgi:hemerythrin-like metal-binding protein
MAFITWNDDFLTGIEIVDRQHHGLVDMINAAAPILLECVPENIAERQRLFDGLIAYTAEHFRTEEAIMAEAGVDARVLGHHQATHAALVQDVLDWRARFDCSDPGAGQKLLGFLAGWLLFHVMGEDQTMARQVRARQEGLAAEAAYATREGNRWSPRQDLVAKTLARVFTQSCGQIQEIALMNNSLEAQVQTRTAELQRMAEELRVARDAAEAASEAKSRFLGLVSHELHTPMNAIIGFTAALRQSGLSRVEQGLASKIDDAAQHLLDMINGLIEYTRDPGAAAAAPFKLSTLLADASRHAFTDAIKKGLRTDIDCDPALPDWFVGDVRRISLIIRQLADNAAKFTETGGVRVGADLINQDAAGVRLRLSVADTGIGIPLDRQTELFDVFKQADDSPTRTHGGVGMGLALTRQAARVMGADVGFYSVPGKGSLFWLDLSLRPFQSPLIDHDEIETTTETVRPVNLLERRPVQDALPPLLVLLRRDDAQAPAYLAEHEADLAAVLGPDFPAIRTLIDNFDLPEALKRLEALVPPSNS